MPNLDARNFRKVNIISVLANTYKSLPMLMLSIEFEVILRCAMTEQRALGDACVRSAFLEHYCLSLLLTNVFECKLLTKGFVKWSVGKTKINICINKG